MRQLVVTSSSRGYIAPSAHSQDIIKLLNGEAVSGIVASVAGSTSSTYVLNGDTVDFNISGAIVSYCPMSSANAVSERLNGVRNTASSSTNYTLSKLTISLGDDFLILTANGTQSFLVLVAPASARFDGVTTSRCGIAMYQNAVAMANVDTKGYLANALSTIQAGQSLKCVVLGDVNANGVYDPSTSGFLTPAPAVVLVSADGTLLTTDVSVRCVGGVLPLHSTFEAGADVWKVAQVHDVSPSFLVKT